MSSRLKLAKDVRFGKNSPRPIMTEPCASSTLSISKVISMLRMYRCCKFWARPRSLDGQSCKSLRSSRCNFVATTKPSFTTSFDCPLASLKTSNFFANTRRCDSVPNDRAVVSISKPIKFVWWFTPRKCFERAVCGPKQVDRRPSYQFEECIEEISPQIRLIRTEKWDTGEVRG